MVLGIQNLFHVGGFLMVLFTTSRENVCQWLIPLGYSIHHHVIQFVSSMSQVDISLWVFHTTSRENICQWLIPLGYSIQHHVIQFVSDLFPWGTLFNIMWYSLSVTYSLGVLYSTTCDTVCQFHVSGRYIPQSTSYYITW
jgi:hypothetical protein